MLNFAEIAHMSDAQSSSATSAVVEPLRSQPRCRFVIGALAGAYLSALDRPAELGALLGAEATLRRHKPDLILELIGAKMSRYGHQPREVVGYLERLGYRRRCFARGTIVDTGDLDEDLTIGTNFLFTARAD
jgi:hypothetical protein